MSNNNSYTCAMCHQTYDKAWSDDEAMQETTSYWPNIAAEDCAVVCDDCFKKIKPERQPEQYKASLLDMYLMHLRSKQ